MAQSPSLICAGAKRRRQEGQGRGRGPNERAAKMVLIITYSLGICKVHELKSISYSNKTPSRYVVLTFLKK